MVLEGIAIRQVDRMWLVRILGHVGKVQAEGLAKAAESDLVLVLQAEPKGLLGNTLLELARYVMCGIRKQ